MNTTCNTEARRQISIHAPCVDMDEAVASAMRRAPDVVEFVGFEQDDHRVAHAAETLECTGHRVSLRA